MSQAIIGSLNGAFSWAPAWVVGVLILMGSAIVALLVFRWVFRLLFRLTRRVGPFVETFVRRSEGPVCVIWLTVVLGAAVAPAQLSYDVTVAIAHLLLVAFILALGWAAVIALDTAADFYIERLSAQAADDYVARKHLTQVHILKRAAQMLTVVITIASALMTFAVVRTYGLSLFASAGAAGLVVGLSARPVLSNLIAGLQIAISQPIRLGDAVIVEGDWGWIETITSTYVVVRTWDLRRLVLPLTYFIEKPFQNWTKESANLIGSIHLHVDYSVPMQPLRDELERIVKASKLWDGKVVVLQVVEAMENTIQLRALASARTAGETWDIRCEVREKLIIFLQQQHPDALPRQRLKVTPSDGGDGPARELESAAAAPVHLR
ncbi:MAG: mechanosensitive ion channel family protein [Acetobacteraceae bacterium]